VHHFQKPVVRAGEHEPEKVFRTQQKANEKLVDKDPKKSGITINKGAMSLEKAAQERRRSGGARDRSDQLAVEDGSMVLERENGDLSAPIPSGTITVANLSVKQLSNNENGTLPACVDAPCPEISLATLQGFRGLGKLPSNLKPTGYRS
jgi:hypothetical protein